MPESITEILQGDMMKSFWDLLVSPILLYMIVPGIVCFIITRLIFKNGSLGWVIALGVGMILLFTVGPFAAGG